MASDDWPDWLPADWTVQIRKIDQRKVKCYIAPEGHKCYSKPQVFEYLNKTNRSMGNEKNHNVDDSTIDLSLDPNIPHTSEIPESSPGGQATKLTPRSSRRKSNVQDLSEASLAGDGSSREHLSSQRNNQDSSWLPDGWNVEVKVRKGGSSSGMRYKCYTDPISGQKFFSKPQVLNFLAKTNGSAGGQKEVSTEPISATPISAWKETTEPDNSQLYEATEVNKDISEKKTESVRLSSDYEVVSRTPVEGLPEGWIKELRMRKGGVQKKDPYYLDPLSEYVFFSKKDALRYLESGDVSKCVMKPLKRDINAEDTHNVNLTSIGGALASPSDPAQGTETPNELTTNGCVPESKANESGSENPKPVRSITGGSFSTPDTFRKEARSTPKDVSDWLPDGWVAEVHFKNSGVKYKIFKESATGKKFYSKPQVLDYLASGSSSNSRKRKEHKSSVAPDLSQNPEPSDATRPKRSVKKKDSVRNAEYEEVITTSPADGLPPGWIKEIRTKIYATHKRNDPFYTDPVSGYIFRSKLDALRFLDTGDVELCAMRPKMKDKDGNEVYVHNKNAVQKPGNSTENHTADPNTAETPKRRVSNRVTKNSPSPTTLPARTSKRQKGINTETNGPTEGNMKQDSGVNLEKQPPDDGQLAYELPEDDNWTDQCIDFAVKTLTSEILFNGQPATGSSFQEGNDGVEETGRGVNETPTKVK